MSLSLNANTPSIVTIAGESGSGKTTMGMMMLGFYTPTFGQVLYQRQSSEGTGPRQRCSNYRRKIQAVFQDPFAVYNPFYKVDNLLSIPIKNFKLARSKAESRELQEEALEAVGLRPCGDAGTLSRTS